jgi:MraZ protein
MSSGFFCGTYTAKLDEKNRFVLPQELRYGLVEDGKLEFTIALSMGGCLAIYKKKDIDEIVEKFRAKRHIAKFQKFFTLFFSTLMPATCDKVGRVTIPSVLKQGVGIKSEIVLAGALDKIELWPKEKYEDDLQKFLTGSSEEPLSKMMEEAFALLSEEEVIEQKDLEGVIDRLQTQTVKL